MHAYHIVRNFWREIFWKFWKNATISKTILLKWLQLFLCSYSFQVTLPLILKFYFWNRFEFFPFRNFPPCGILKLESIPYNRNHPRKKSFTNYLLCHSSRENFCDSGNLIYKNSSQDKKYKKAFANASRFAKFENFFFHGQFPLYGMYMWRITTKLMLISQIYRNL